MDRASRKRGREQYAAVVNQISDIPDVYGVKRRASEKKLRCNNAASTTPDRLEENEDDEFGDLDLFDISDTVVTAQYLIDKLSLTDKAKRTDVAAKLPRICFLHQIYSILPDNTAVDRELKEAIDTGSWRKFHIVGSLEDEFAIMKTTDYVATIDDAKREYIAEEESRGDNKKPERIVVTADLFDRFKRFVLDKRHNDVAVSQKSEEFTFNDKEVSCLVKHGLMLPHIQKTDTYWFAIRRQGMFMSHYLKGRTEILRILKKRPTHDILEKQLAAKKLRSIFRHEFILHDLVGSGRAERYI
ncbi:serine-threonine protein kinase 19-domain-containing protein [Zychaea mexicana]|uniref:serine-threonine protein kinase 19-domain-containing protein n=1 Tax=Zychaea mexicana TaxID=64656 RepID=UPI0022FEDBD7|nr:serine-threonine protein kinase 19-domain-containing protein [Zychaea mexicana]KAI9497249.1 serine-threonine protein kinase 19-domain-containing protein [Zychaea mexicana]